MAATERKDQIAIPEVALRHAEEGDHHVGRGGAGNEEHMHAHKDGESAHMGLADKLKNKLFKKKTSA